MSAVLPTRITFRQESRPDKNHVPTRITSRQESRPDKTHVPTRIISRQKRITFSSDQNVSRLLVNIRETTPPPHMVPAYPFTDQYFRIGTSTVPSSTVPSDVSPPAARPENPKNLSRLTVAPLP